MVDDTNAETESLPVRVRVRDRQAARAALDGLTREHSRGQNYDNPSPENGRDAAWTPGGFRGLLGRSHALP